MSTGPAATVNGTKVLTGKVRLSYVNLFRPRKRDAEDAESAEQYSVLLLIPKTDTSTRAALKQALEAAKEAKWGGKPPSNLKTIVKDGDERDDLDEKPEYRGMIYMSVSSYTKPGIVDRNVQPIIDPSELYSGCYARVELNASGYEKKVNRGLTFYINHVQKLADGDPLGNVTRAEDVFEPLGDEYDDDTIGASDGSDLL